MTLFKEKERHAVQNTSRDRFHIFSLMQYLVPNQQYILPLTILVILLVVVASLLPLFSVTAQEATPYYPTDDEVNAIARQLYCPVCENVPLDVCGTQACAQWRELIREKLIEGWTEDDIKTYFSNQYGDRALAEPPARGFNWLVYIIPPVVFIAGAIFLYRGFTTWKQISAEDEDIEESELEPDIEDPYMARLEEELKNSSE
jgi:cytochrome c-type biogenesis protein CcmH